MAKNPSWKPAASTCVAQTRYNPATQQLDVQFANSGRRYRYEGVSPTRARGIHRAASAGGYLNRNIKPGHPVRRIPGAK